MILCVGTTPALQRVMVFPRLALSEVNRAVATHEGPSGKAINVAKALKVLGERPIVVGFIGGSRGDYLREALARLEIETDFVSIAAPTRECVTVIDESAETQTELVEESGRAEPGDFDQIIAKIGARSNDCRGLVLSGTVAPGGPRDFCSRCLRALGSASAIKVLDARGSEMLDGLEAQPNLVKPNRTELAATLGRKFESESDIIAAMRELVERGAKQVVVTGGRDTSFAFDGIRAWRIAVPQIKVVNPIGSGDAFAAGVVSRLVRGEVLDEACRWATAAAAANALTPMPGELHLPDVERLLAQVQVTRI